MSLTEEQLIEIIFLMPENNQDLSKRFDIKNPKHLVSVSLFAFLMLAIPLTVFSTLNSPDPRSEAAAMPNKKASSISKAPDVEGQKSETTLDVLAGAAGDCTTNPVLDDQEVEFLRLINNHRAANGRSQLTASYTLSKAAQWKSEDMGRNVYFAHDDLNRTWVQRIRDCGYTANAWLGENIAGGTQSAQAAFDIFKSSPGHNDNMLNSNYYTIGIGRAYVDNGSFGWYWTTEFASIPDGWPDTNPSSISILNPANGSNVSGTVNVQVNASDSISGVFRVEFFVDNSKVFTALTSPFTFVWNTSQLSDGVHNLTAKAFDVNNNQGIAQVSVTVSNTDSDGDGFSDSVETFMGTNPNLRCGLNAWPPDVNNSSKVDGVDIGLVRNKFNLAQGTPGYLVRYDLNADGRIDATDIAIVRGYFYRTCN